MSAPRESVVDRFLRYVRIDTQSNEDSSVRPSTESQWTLARLLARETGMSFGRWRQQLNIMLAVKWLGTGASVQRVADGLGYESAGSFVTMFRKALGTSPGRYLAERTGDQPRAATITADK